MIPKFAASEIYCPERASPLQKGHLILYLLYLQHLSEYNDNDNSNNSNSSSFFLNAV